jgi:hypothetical protein
MKVVDIFGSSYPFDDNAPNDKKEARKSKDWNER